MGEKHGVAKLQPVIWDGGRTRAGWQPFLKELGLSMSDLVTTDYPPGKQKVKPHYYSSHKNKYKCKNTNYEILNNKLKSIVYQRGFPTWTRTYQQSNYKADDKVEKYPNMLQT